MICSKCARTISDDSTFCSFCGEKRTEPENAHELSTTVNQSKLEAKSSRSPRLIIILFSFALILSIIGNLFQASNNESLSIELAESQKNIEELSQQIVKANNRISDLNYQISGLKSRAETAENKVSSMKTAETIYSGMKSFLSNNRSDAFKKYQDIYTRTNAIVIKKGSTVDISVVWANSGYIYCNCDDASIISLKWSKNWTGSTTSLNITGLQAGVSVIRIYNDFNDHEVKVLAIVVD